jgi:serine/threonine-protein kinase RsbW
VTYDRGVQVGDRVTVSVPASSAYVAPLRSLAAGLAARLELTIDDVEDVRMAVDEACALLLPLARRGSDLQCVIELDEAAVAVSVSVTSDAPAAPSRTDFGWTVLTALAHEVDDDVSDDRVTLRLRKRGLASA